MKLSVQIRALYQHDHSDQFALETRPSNPIFIVTLRPINADDENATPRLGNDINLIVSADEINNYKVGQILEIQISDALAGMKI